MYLTDIKVVYGKSFSANPFIAANNNNNNNNNNNKTNLCC